MKHEMFTSFDNLVQEYYQAWFRFHPEQAVEAGVEGYAGLLRPFSDDDTGVLISLNEKLLDALDEIEPATLDANREIDLKILRGAARLELHDLLERDWRLRDPAGFLPVNAIYQLTVRPVRDLESALVARLGKIPDYLRDAAGRLRQQTGDIPAQWLVAAIAEAQSGVDYFRSLHNHPLLSKQCHDLGKIHGLLDAAGRSLQQFARVLETEVAAQAAAEFACGREAYDRLLRDRHFLGIDADGLHELGSRLVDETQQALLSVCKELGFDSIEALQASVSQDHPSADELLSNYRAGIQSAHAFVEQQQLVSLPRKQRLKVVATPKFLIHQIPFAAYLEPSPHDIDQCGYYYVTPVNEPSLLAEHHPAAIAATCVHEAWPGHHLQFVTANCERTSRTLPRLLNPSATLYEGWALYCEQLMLEQGFLDHPYSEAVMLRDRLWRALRIVLDVELHTRGLSQDAAARRMSETLVMPLEQARADILWYTRSPTVAMGYATGWALLQALREILLPDLHQAASLPSESDLTHLKVFHDQILGCGSIALPLVIQHQFGEPVWQAVSSRAFGSE
ncbi:MAG TPA: DUF885 domain-containing protein [Gammaproteobacteria bacterium]|nr:DUF885 domain-containing protein [Gammaproteobacteria bacterium]